jgi:uncharacterized C2H2 Zn-finger protein
MRDFLREGSHTWDLVTDYHQCPECGTIIENRERYEKRFGGKELDIHCSHCDAAFKAVKKERITFGPLTGR